jgi:hypothetical protein
MIMDKKDISDHKNAQFSLRKITSEDNPNHPSFLNE